MNRYLVKTKAGWLKIVYGSYIKARMKAGKGNEIKTIPDHIKEDDIWYGRVSFDDL